MGFFSDVLDGLGGIVPKVIGGFLDRDDERDRQQEAQQWNREQAEWELTQQDRMRSEDRDLAQAFRNQEYERQKEFAQMGVRWKMDDARAAGIHPVAALGGSGASYSPTIVMPASHPVPSAGRMSPGSGGGSAVGDAIRAMGQNTIRAEMATKTESERRLEELAIRNAELRNSSLELELAARAKALLQPANPPAPDAVGVSVPAGSVRVVPDQVTSSRRGEPAVTAGSHPLETEYNMGGGARISLPSKSAAESLEVMGPLAAPAAMTISGLRRFIHGPEKPAVPLPKGMRWEWDVWSQSFRAVAPRSYEERIAPYGARRYWRDR